METKEEKASVGHYHTTLGFVILCVLTGALWLFCTYIVFRLFPDWQIRGQVGDSFGAANALFSGLAFAGVIYSLYLQRSELASQREELQATRAVYKAQLDEMRSSRELQAQPLLIPGIAELQIDKPRFFYTPPEDNYSAVSRYTVAVPLSNPTAHPALSINVRCRVVLPESQKTFSAVDEYVAIVPPGGSLAAESAPDFLFARDSAAQLFDALRQNDPRKVPIVWVMIVFKNIVGAHFHLLQGFSVYVLPKQADSVRLWHTAIAGFEARYKQELISLREYRRSGRHSEWDALFEKVKNEFSASATGDDHIGLIARPIPQSFSLKQITAEEYDSVVKGASYPKFVGGHYDCPAELDSRTFNDQGLGPGSTSRSSS